MKALAVAPWHTDQTQTEWQKIDDLSERITKMLEEDTGREAELSERDKLRAERIVTKLY